jgi:hypothetical protein
MLPRPDEGYDTSFLRPTVGSSDTGHYDIVLVESSEGEPTPNQTSRSTSIPMELRLP